MTAPWPDEARRVLLLTLLREGQSFGQVAATFGCSEDEARAQAQAARAAGLVAIGAKRRAVTPTPSRRCLCCRQPFAPTHRFNFLCPSEACTPSGVLA